LIVSLGLWFGGLTILSEPVLSRVERVEGLHKAFDILCRLAQCGYERFCKDKRSMANKGGQPSKYKATFNNIGE
jgi:hypothetical protein